MSNLATVQKIYHAFGKGDVQSILEKLSEKIKWEYHANDYGIPWLKPGTGKLHVLEFFKLVGREFEMSKFEVRGILESGPQVIALIEIEAKIRSTGKSIKDAEVHLWTFDDQGTVKYFRHIVDTHQHFLASKR